MAHTKATATTKNNRESESKRLGVKLFGGQITQSGSIIIRQRGTKFVPGIGVKIGSDDTIYSIKKGKVKFTTKKIRHFNGSKRLVKIVNVI